MNFKKLILFAVTIICGYGISNNVIADEVADQFSVFVPTAVITLTHDESKQVTSVSCLNSDDNLKKGLKCLWSVYKIDMLEDKEIYTYLGAINDESDINSGLKVAPLGLYSLVLTVTNVDGISNSTQQVINIDAQSNTRRAYGKIAKVAIKKLITSFRSGWVGSLARQYLKGDAYKKIEQQVIVRLEKMLQQYDKIFGQQVVGLLIDGFIAAGMSPANARWVAEMIVAVFF
jgi:hypothetical protein